MTLKVKLYCVEDGCEREVHNLARQLCRGCYQRLRKIGEFQELETCKHPSCRRKECYKGTCVDHRHIYFPEVFEQVFRYSKMLDPSRERLSCSEELCPREAVSNGKCSNCDQKATKRDNGFVPKLQRYVQLDGSRVKCAATSEECDSGAISNGLCRKHLQRVAKYGSDDAVVDTDICPVIECGRVKRIRSKICKRCNQFRWRYSLTAEEVIELHLPENRGCSNPGCLDTERLHMDHDHSCCPPGEFEKSHKVSCGECVRGWLCHKCNVSLGMLQENPERIRGLIVHIESGRFRK